MNRTWIAAAVAVCLAGCSRAEPEVAWAQESRSVAAEPTSTAPVCEVAETGGILPDAVREISGLARSRRDPGIFWAHNDSGNDPELFAVDTAGRLVQRVQVAGAELEDWEDLAAGACDAGNCLYISDTGDNDGERERVTIYRIPEPEAGASETSSAAALHARYPEGPRDAESLFVLPSGEIFVVTKGRYSSIDLYRYPLPQRPGETVTLQWVRQLFPEPEDSDDRVTAATASPDGRWVGIRTYRTLYLYPAAELVGDGAAEPTTVDLEPLNEQQGESLSISADGSVWLASEAEDDDTRPQWAQLRCTFPAGAQP